MDYVLVTPARNAAGKIEHTLDAVTSQTRPPLRWVVVSDASTDRTEELVRERQADHPWLSLVRVEPSGLPGFASKVNAFSRGVQELAGLDYAFLGNLDADVSFAPDYFERLLAAFEADPKLGLAGGQVYECFDGKRIKQDVAANSVPGAVQLFRREVFERIGGLRPMALGGEDTAAEILTRMEGWTTHTFGELEVDHHGPVVSGRGGRLGYLAQRGRINHSLGYHPLFHLSACVYRGLQWPWVVGGLAMAAGYFGALLRGRERSLPTEAIVFLRTEQMRRLRGMLGGSGLDRA